MKRFIIVGIVIFMLIVSMLPVSYSGNAKLLDQKMPYICNVDEQYIDNFTVVSNNNLTDSKIVVGYGDEFGVWIHTTYDGVDDSIKLDIDLEQFSLMLKGGSWKDYKLTMENVDDTTADLQFVRTKIFLEDGSDVDVVQTQFTVETSCDTVEDYEISLEVRFPFSLLKSKAKSYNSFSGSFDNTKNNKIINILERMADSIKSGFFGIFYEKLINFLQRDSNTYANPMSVNSESYFCARMGYSSPENDEGPNRVETRFFFGRNSIWEPRVFRMKITPYDLGREFKLTYNTSYLTVDQSGNEAFYRVFSVDFEPAAELQITSIPREFKINYNFGSSSGAATKISFGALGGVLSDIDQSFFIDPLPEHMSFDLTILGERSFKYESNRSYSVMYSMDSLQEGNLVKLELEDLPKELIVEWGLSIKLLALTASGFIDLEMSSDITRAALSLYGSEKPFVEVGNFPRKLRVDGYIDVLDLKGHIRISKYSGATTTITVPVSYDKWDITGTLKLNSGSGNVSFNLPSGDSSLVYVGLDTNGNALFGIDLSIVDTQTDVEVLHVGVEGIATDDLYVSFEGNVENLQCSGKVTKLIDLIISVNFQEINFDISGSWNLGDEGSFLIEVNQEVDLSLDNIEAAGFIIDGSLSLNPGSYLKMEWVRGDEGYFLIQTHDINAEADVTFGDKYSSNIYFSVSVILDSHAIVKFEWEWGQIGHVMVFTNLFEELDFEVGYNYDPGYNEYQYGLKAHATDVGFTRTLQWDLENGFRFWWLGDDELPDNWDVQLLWNYEWRDVL
ncbi:MAG: hypothetical protein KAW47_08610 [Thermoplasmatales archaeon]|nr:hypothetical protein [Thermoplasmatales archaeon]